MRKKVMLSFVEFLREKRLFEGGNVEIDGIEAERIDLMKFDRDFVVEQVNRLLNALNKMFERDNGLPIWKKELFADKTFLSGSALHFFDKAIPTPEFVKFKNTVGDIDTQVDEALAEKVEKFLNSIKGKEIEGVKFIGFKKSAGQFISLWAFENPKVNIQIDLEFVDFLDGRPTPWSQFSHSSPWNDISQGIKGVFQKYLLRALTSIDAKEIYLEVLKGRGKNRKAEFELKRSYALAFSVQKGLREKLEPVFENNKQKFIDGIPVFREIEPKDSTYIKDLDVIFRMLFKVQPSAKDLSMFNSFVGIIELMKKYLSREEQERISQGFLHTLFGIKGGKAQVLYRNNNELDQKEKMTAALWLFNNLNLNWTSEHDQMRIDYYEAVAK